MDNSFAPGDSADAMQGIATHYGRYFDIYNVETNHTVGGSHNGPLLGKTTVSTSLAMQHQNLLEEIPIEF